MITVLPGGDKLHRMKRRQEKPLALDHRGRPCELIDSISRDLPRELIDALPEPGWRTKGRGAEGHWTLVVGMGVWFVGAGLILNFVPAPWKWLAMFLPIGASSLVLLPPFSRAWRRAAGEAIIETTLRFNLCPGCGYTLEDLAVEGDGCLQCPECGAAWRPCEKVDAGQGVSSARGRRA